MIREFEKKYALTPHDTAIIDDICQFDEEVILKDYYLDKDFILAKNNYYLRLRNSVYELKKVDFEPKTQMVSSDEFTTDDSIEAEIEQFGITTDDVSGIMFIETIRKKYHYEYKWYAINIDVETYQYGDRYEIEMVVDSEQNNSKEDFENDNTDYSQIIDDFRKHIGLTSESDISHSKTINCAMHQNIELYEIMTKSKI